LGSLSRDAETPPILSVSTAVVSTPRGMAPFPSAAKSSPLSVLLGTKTFPMPPMRASPQPPLRVQLLPQLCRLPQQGTGLVSPPQVNLRNPKLFNRFVVRPPSLTSPLRSPTGTSLMLAAPSSEQEVVPTGASPRRPTSTWSFRCRQAQPQHRVLLHPNHPNILVVQILSLFRIIVSVSVMFCKLSLVFLLR